MKICPACQLKYTDEDTRCLVDNSSLAPLDNDQIGNLLAGRYLLECVIGEGGMATVYRARNELSARPVAIKLMSPHLAGDPSIKERFRREAKNAASVAHPNIIDIHDYGETDDGTPFLVMELLEGSPLDQLIKAGPLSSEQACSIGMQIARGLARAHDFGLIHRDLKPENVFVAIDEEGEPLVKLLDFGIACSINESRISNAGQLYGTPQYLAPERISSNDSGASADLYALGVMLFEMVTGRLPFVADDVAAFLMLHMTSVPPRPSSFAPNIPQRLEDLILQLLAKKPDERPVDAHAVEKELSAIAPQRGTSQVALGLRTTLTRMTSTALPPTTLERWAARVGLFQAMLEKAYPDRSPPAALSRSLVEIVDSIARLHELRARSLSHHRALEAMEEQARERRERLGHAMSVLGTDLSSARESLRNARNQVRPYLDASSVTKTNYRRAYRRFRELGDPDALGEPSRDWLEVTRVLADEMETWFAAHETAERAIEWLESAQNAVRDLQFQIDALRTRVERLEHDYEQERRAREEALRDAGREIEALEKELLAAASAFLGPLRSRPELSELWNRLEEGTPYAGISRDRLGA